MRSEFLYKPQGRTLFNFHKSNAFVRCVIGPLGSGKTQACISEVLRRVNDQKPNKQNVRRSRVAIVRNTYADLISTTLKDWDEITGGLGIGRIVQSPIPRHDIEYLHDDGVTTVKAEILFLAFDRPDHVRKIRGLQLTWAYCNETKELAKPVIDMIMARLGRFPSRASLGNYPFGMICDSNAPDADHWLGKLVLKTKPVEWDFFLQPAAVIKTDGGAWMQNPAAENLRNLPENYYQRLISAKSDDWIRANLGNEFILVIDGRSVHPDFSQTTHVSTAPLEPRLGLPLYVGIDFGRTPAAVIGQQDDNGRWFIYDEVVTENTGALRFGEILAKHLNTKYEGFQVYAYGDPAGNQQAQTRDETPFDMLEISEIYADPAPTNDFEERTAALDVNLRRLIGGNPAIIIAAKCVTVIKGLAGAYCFKRVQISGEERYQDKPDKGPTSHAVEALHYMLLGAGEGERLFSNGHDQVLAEIEQENGGWAPDQSHFE